MKYLQEVASINPFDLFRNARGGDFHYISVNDNGIGIDPPLHKFKRRVHMNYRF